MPENYQEMAMTFQDHLAKHSAPRHGSYVEIEISPPDHMQKHTETTNFWDRFHRFKETWAKILKTLKSHSSRVEVIEQSQPGRLHIHAIYKLTSPQEFLHELSRIRLGANNETKRNKAEVYVAFFKIYSKEHLMERIAYLAKDVKTFREDDYEPVISSKGRLQELLDEAIARTESRTTGVDEW